MTSRDVLDGLRDLPHGVVAWAIFLPAAVICHRRWLGESERRRWWGMLALAMPVGAFAIPVGFPLSDSLSPIFYEALASPHPWNGVPEEMSVYFALVPLMSAAVIWPTMTAWGRLSNSRNGAIQAGAAQAIGLLLGCGIGSAIATYTELAPEYMQGYNAIPRSVAATVSCAIDNVHLFLVTAAVFSLAYVLTVSAKRPFLAAAATPLLLFALHFPIIYFPQRLIPLSWFSVGPIGDWLPSWYFWQRVAGAVLSLGFVAWLLQQERDARGPGGPRHGQG